MGGVVLAYSVSCPHVRGGVGTLSGRGLVLVRGHWAALRWVVEWVSSRFIVTEYGCGCGVQDSLFQFSL